jgi:signal transduction histidine kinase
MKSHAGNLLRTLSRSATYATLAGIFVFLVTATVVLYVDLPANSLPTPEPGETLFEELAEHLVWAALIATPTSVVCAVLVSYLATKDLVRRIKTLTLSAQTIDANSLVTRLHVEGDDELTQLGSTLNELLLRVENGVEAQRQFSADVAHELRTPLAVLISSLEVIRNRPRAVDELEDAIDTSLTEARQLADLVQALLLATQPERSHEDHSEVDLGPLLSRVVEKQKAQSARVRWSLEISETPWLRADPRLLEIALHNLMSNAVRHSPKDGTVTVRARSTQNGVRIEVEDQGPGVAASDAARIFEPFVRGAPPGDGPVAGFGLGLSIVRRIVGSIGGMVSVESGRSGGACFVVELVSLSPG